MSFDGGQTSILNLSTAAFNHSRDEDNLPDNAFRHGSKNLYPMEGGLRKRGGTSHVYDAAFSGTPTVTAVGYITDYNGNKEIIVSTDDGKIYKDDTNTIKTGLTDNVTSSMITAEDQAYICNGNDIPQVYAIGDGSTHDYTNPPSDWSEGSYPTNFIPHSLGGSSRLIVPGVSNYPYIVYISYVDDLEDMSDANVVVIPVWTKDPKGLTGGVSYGGRCILFDEYNAYYLDDSNVDTDLWGYVDAQWVGGLAHHRLVVPYLNDIIAMARDGTIYSVTTAEQYGDYKQASISEQQHIHEWIKEYINLSAINNFHAVYDPDIKAVRFFMQYSGSTTNDVCLLYYPHLPVGQRWFIEDNKDYASGFNAYCSGIVLDGSSGRQRCYTGDYSGNVWRLNDSTFNDNSNGYYAGMKLKYHHLGNIRAEKKFRSGMIVGETSGSSTINIKTRIDGTELTAETATLSGGSQFGNAQFGSAQFGSRRPRNAPYQIRDKGYRISTEIYNDTENESMRLSSLLIDYKNLGNLPGY